jgi:hypothetical protein
MPTISSILDHYLEPVTSMFNREMAEAIVNRKSDELMVARVRELGRKADEGTLTEEEKNEYENYVDAGDLIALIKSKARRFLDENPG